jgi:hypothetical protein
LAASAGDRRRSSAAARAAILAIIAVALAAAPARAESCTGADAQPGQVSQHVLDAATICLLNQQRAAAGLVPLRRSRPLERSAGRYAAYMVSTDHFAHIDQDGHDVIWRVLHTDTRLAPRWRLIGEDLGWGTFNLATPRAIVTAGLFQRRRAAGAAARGGSPAATAAERASGVVRRRQRLARIRRPQLRHRARPADLVALREVDPLLAEQRQRLVV